DSSRLWIPLRRLKSAARPITSTPSCFLLQLSLPNKSSRIDARLAESFNVTGDSLLPFPFDRRKGADYEQASGHHSRFVGHHTVARCAAGRHALENCAEVLWGSEPLHGNL